MWHTRVFKVLLTIVQTCAHLYWEPLIFRHIPKNAAYLRTLFLPKCARRIRTFDLTSCGWRDLPLVHGALSRWNYLDPITFHSKCNHSQLLSRKALKLHLPTQVVGFEPTVSRITLWRFTPIKLDLNVYSLKIKEQEQYYIKLHRN